MRLKPVYISAAGISSPFGDDLESLWQALLASPGWKEHTILAGGRPRRVKARLSAPAEYEDDPTGYFVRLSHHALKSLLAECPKQLEGRGCLLLGSGMGASDRYLSAQPVPAYWEEEILRRICDGLTGRLPVKWLANACCAGAQAIAYGCDLIRSGECDFVIAGGAESFSYLTYAGFERLHSIDPEGCRPFDRGRRGIGVGEGAAFFLLSAQRPSAPLGCLLGCAMTSDAFHLVSPEPHGAAVRKVMSLALQRSLLLPSQVDAVIAHGTGTRANDAVEAAAIYDLMGDTPVTAPKGSLGHTGGASGPFQLAAVLGCLRHQIIPAIAGLTHPDETLPIRPVLKTRGARLRRLLVNCFAFGGSNVSMVCADDHEARYRPMLYLNRLAADETVAGSRPVEYRTVTLPQNGGALLNKGAMNRWTDRLCVCSLALAERILKESGTWEGRYDVGVVLSVSEGARESLTRCAAMLRDGETGRLNPGQFPHVMLSTALSYLTQRLDARGPSCVFLEQDGAEAERFARVQLALGHCKTMLCFFLNDANKPRASVWINEIPGGVKHEGSPNQSQGHDIQPQ